MAHESFLTDCIDALDRLDSESARKIEYITEQIMAGNREPGDESLLITTAREIIRSAARTAA